MFVRLPAMAAIAALMALSMVRDASAQDQPSVPQSLPPLNLSVTFAPAASDGSAPSGQSETSGPSMLMMTLYSTTVMVQGVDTHSTFEALDAGAIERNPLLSGLTRHKVVFVAFKAGVATGLILAARNLAKDHKFLAAALLIGVNSAHAYLAMRNYRVARMMK